jgi:hypothetical protein
MDGGYCQAELLRNVFLRSVGQKQMQPPAHGVECIDSAIMLLVEPRFESGFRQLSPEGIGSEAADIPQRQKKGGIDLTLVPDL